MAVNANITCKIKGVDDKILKGKRVLKIHEEHPEVRIYEPHTGEHEIEAIDVRLKITNIRNEAFKNVSLEDWEDYGIDHGKCDLHIV